MGKKYNRKKKAKVGVKLPKHLKEVEEEIEDPESDAPNEDNNQDQHKSQSEDEVSEPSPRKSPRTSPRKSPRTSPRKSPRTSPQNTRERGKGGRPPQKRLKSSKSKTTGAALNSPGGRANSTPEVSSDDDNQVDNGTDSEPQPSTSSQIPQKRGRGRPPNKRTKANESTTKRNSISSPRRNRNSLSDASGDDGDQVDSGNVSEPEPQPSTSQIPQNKGRGRPPSKRTKASERGSGNTHGPPSKRLRTTQNSRKKNINASTLRGKPEGRAKIFHAMKRETLGSIFAKLAIRALVQRSNEFFQGGEDDGELEE